MCEKAWSHVSLKIRVDGISPETLPSRRILLIQNKRKQNDD